MIHMIKKYGSDARLLGLLILLISLASLGGALLSQFGFDMKPCLLCLWQRGPHSLNILFALGALFFATCQPKTAALFIFLAAISYFIGTGIAIYHTGVEQQWWQGFEGCSFPKLPTGDFDAFKEALLKTEFVSCKDIPFELFGISMAGYNALLSFFSGIAFAIGSILVMRKANNML